MTLKYESEILFDLMKRDGDDAPSDVLPYESELKEKYLQQVEGAYPKLMDYRPEWLNYNLIAHLPADFPVETLSNVTRATVDNVVPYAYGSASLKGNTLVNLFDRNSMTLEGLTYTFDNGVYTINATKEWCKLIFTPNLVQNKKYFIMLSTSINDVIIFYRNSSDEPTRICSGEQCPFIFTNPIDNLKNVTIEFPSIVTNGKVSHPMFIEYQEGMENWDIPYFEGMKSVQMPVLKTSGKNLYNASDPTMKCSWWIAVDDGIPNLRKENLSTNYSVIVPARSSTKYTYNGSGMNRNYYAFLDKDYNILHVSDIIQATIASPQNTSYVLFYLNSKNIENVANLQIEEGSVATSYEPYKSNILTVNEDVTLRGIGDVKDELNLITGELTQRIGEVVLDGSEANWSKNNISNNREKTSVFTIKRSEFKANNNSVISILSNSLQSLSASNQWTNDIEGVALNEGNTILVSIDKNKLESDDLNGFKKWLSQNPITVQCIFTSESVKTVDFTVTDLDGNTTSIIRPIEGTMHLMTEGDAIKPLFSGEVPVEAITQNLASFIKG